jgi:hypothetical protein
MSLLSGFLIATVVLIFNYISLSCVFRSVSCIQCTIIVFLDNYGSDFYFFGHVCCDMVCFGFGFFDNYGCSDFYFFGHVCCDMVCFGFAYEFHTICQHCTEIKIECYSYKIVGLHTNFIQFVSTAPR